MAVRALRNGTRGSFDDDSASGLPRFRTHIDQPIRSGDDIEIVLHDQDRVPLVHKAAEDREQLHHVSCVQTGCRFIKNEKRRRRLLGSHQLSRNFYPLSFSSGQGC